MSELKWNWAYFPYLDAPNKQKESALKAGYIKVVSKSEADKVIAEKDKEIAELKQKLHDAEMRADLAEAACTEYRDDYRKLDRDFLELTDDLKQTLRALWLARAERASEEADSFDNIKVTFNGLCNINHSTWPTKGAHKIPGEKSMKTTQNTQILKAFKDGARLTPMDALQRFGCFRLGARIADLRKAGHKVKVRMVQMNGKTFAQYYMGMA